VATTIGVFLAYSPLSALLAVAVCAAVIKRTGYVSAGSLALAATLPMALLVTGNAAYIPVSLVVAAWIAWRHRDNISRLLAGEEKSWRKTS